MDQLSALFQRHLAHSRARKIATGVALSGSVVFWLLHQRRRRQAKLKALTLQQTGTGDFVVVDPKRKGRVAVNRDFFIRLRSLLKIVLPSWKSKQFFILFLHTSFLVSRTLLSIYVAKLDGQIVKSIVDKQPKQFLWLLAKWLTVALPATYINSMIRFLESKLSIAFRSRLVEHCYKQYMESETYYRIGNLDSRLSNPDQCLTEDVAQFCGELAHLYSQLSKPIFDVVLMTAQLIMLSKGRDDSGKSGKGDIQGAFHIPGLLAAVVIAGTGLLLRLFTPPFGKMIAEEAKRYGELRAVHSRVITHAEEIAFYGGHKVEENVLFEAYNALVRHMNKLYKTRIPYTMLEQFLMKYVWGACGMAMIAIPTFTTPEKLKNGAKDTEEVSNRTQDFITARGLLISAADAIERLLSSWKEITELAGRTARVSEMITIFEEVKNGRYEKQTVSESEGKAESKALVLANGGKTPKVGAGAAAAAGGARPSSTEAKSAYLAQTSEKIANSLGDGKVNGINGTALSRSVHLGDAEEDPAETEAKAKLEAARKAKRDADAVIAAGTGTIITDQPFIELKDVPVVTPNGDVLVANPGLNFKIERGMHLLITGPNGCGKSSLFRMIGGLWPVKGGVMSIPGKGDMFYIPQRPYLSTSCLREQFIYPHTTEDMQKRGFTDEDLNKLADVVNLRYVVEREGGWDAVCDWKDVLSGGEKQRVGMARVFYHKPHFAILDECTSAVSIDVEGQMYTYAKEIGITLLTVTHRPTLWKFHTHLLQFDGTGNWKFSALNADARLSLQDEKVKIEAALGGVPKQQARLKELCELLGERSIYAK